MKRATRALALAGIWIAFPAGFWISVLDGVSPFSVALMGAALASALILMAQD